jgi:ribulose-5-phosphate 4-epimerase/fuculose-1-phosphate aldolase
MNKPVENIRELSKALPKFNRSKCSRAEWELRVELAAAFRLVHHFGWDLLIYNFISARLPGAEGHLLINPFGMSYDEISASTLLKIDGQGNNLLHSPYRVSRAGFVIHGAIHEARPELGCVMHIHTPAASAVSTMEDGLLPLDQEAMIFTGRVAYHDHQGIPLGDEERVSLVEDLGDKQIMILRNHGLLTAGKTVGEAFTYMYFLELACRNQLAILSTGRKLRLPSPEVAAHVAKQFVQHSEEYNAGGPLEFAAMMRRLDRIDPSYRT